MCTSNQQRPPPPRTTISTPWGCVHPPRRTPPATRRLPQPKIWMQLTPTTRNRSTRLTTREDISPRTLPGTPRHFLRATPRDGVRRDPRASVVAVRAVPVPDHQPTRREGGHEVEGGLSLPAAAGSGGARSDRSIEGGFEMRWAGSREVDVDGYGVAALVRRVPGRVALLCYRNPWLSRVVGAGRVRV